MKTTKQATKLKLNIKDKRLIVYLTCFISFALVFVTGNTIIDYFSIKLPEIFYQFLGGVAFLLAGLICGLIDLENDEKHIHLVMYIPAKYYPKIFTILSAILIVDSILTYYKIV